MGLGAFGQIWVNVGGFFWALGFLWFWVLWALHAGFRVGPYGFGWIFLFMD
jgi:hypothetical protein